MPPARLARSPGLVQSLCAAGVAEDPRTILISPGAVPRLQLLIGFLGQETMARTTAQPWRGRGFGPNHRAR